MDNALFQHNRGGVEGESMRERYTEPLTKKEKESLIKSRKDYKEGRTYPIICKHYKGYEFFVCWQCVVEACDRWYLLGRKDSKKGLRIRRRSKEDVEKA